MSILRELLAQAVAAGASDIHLKAGNVPVFRISGTLTPQGKQIVTPEVMDSYLKGTLPTRLTRQFEIEHEADFSLAEEDVGRFRVNAFVCQGNANMVLRNIKNKIPTFEQLHLPPQLKKFADISRGIVLASGTTGSGKSTSLAAIMHEISVTRNCRIITIEDPIEYMFKDDKSIISQREVGLDTMSFHAALKHVLRQDPDVIMVGEMRDAESFMAALSAAETGHIIFSTLHTSSASSSIARIMDFFPSSERDQIRMALANSVHAVFCQRLIPSIRGGVVPAVEIMINNGTIAKIIRKNKLELLEAAIEVGAPDGMQTFNSSIYDLIKTGQITEEEGMDNASNPEALKMRLKGINLDESSRILQI
ncbi:MAG: type IV pilus twitching motility protein PilT [Kiritimatiellia bacterium]